MLVRYSNKFQQWELDAHVGYGGAEEDYEQYVFFRGGSRYQVGVCSAEGEEEHPEVARSPVRTTLNLRIPLATSLTMERYVYAMQKECDYHLVSLPSQS